MNKLIVLSFTLCLISLCAFAQIDAERIQTEIDSLYQLSKVSFKPIISSDSYEQDDETYFDASFAPSGATNTKISVDEEDSRSYYTYFELVSLKYANEQLEALAQAITAVCEPYGLVRSKGTDIKYQNLQAIRIEYDSENIDVLGKHPSFTIGILKNSQPPTIELILNEPLWK